MGGPRGQIQEDNSNPRTGNNHRNMGRCSLLDNRRIRNSRNHNLERTQKAHNNIGRYIFRNGKRRNSYYNAFITTTTEYGTNCLELEQLHLRLNIK